MNYEQFKTEYLTTDVSLTSLAESHGISPSGLKAYAAKNGWWSEKKALQSGAQKPKKQSEKSALREKIDRLTEQITEKVSEAISQLEIECVKGETFATGLVDTQKMRHIIQSVKDLKDILGDDDGDENLRESQEELIKVIEKAVKK